MNRDIIIERAEKVHQDKGYIYDKVTDAKTSEKITVICPHHGEFYPRLDHFLAGHGCMKCSGKFLKTLKEFEADARKVHGDKYEYVEYNGAREKAMIICPKHGPFWQTPTNHISGKNGCPQCKLEMLAEKFSSNTDEFIRRAMEVHKGRYIYNDETVYVNNHTPLKIICPKHGPFWQTPYGHLSGRGCQKCRRSKLEIEVEEFLKEKGIEYVYQWHLPWAKYFSLDFYLPKHNIGIECQGIQHFEENHFFEDLEDIQKRDEFKRKSCNDNGIEILYYSNVDKEENCISNQEVLFEEISKHVRQAIDNAD